MTDTGQVPGEGLPESAGMVEQPGVPAHGAYAYLSETPAEDEDLLLPGSHGAWGNEVSPPAPEPVLEAVHEPGPHETAGRDTGSVDLGGVRHRDQAATPPAGVPAAVAARRPLHLGPPIPDASASPVRSLADRGPADAPVRRPGPPTTGPEYLDVPQLRETAPQGAAPWGAQPAVATPPVSAGAGTAETAFPGPGPQPVGAAQAAVAPYGPDASHRPTDGQEPVPGETVTGDQTPAAAPQLVGAVPGVPVPGAGGEPGGGSDGGARSGGAVAGVASGAGQVPAGGRTPEAGPQPEGVVAGVAPDEGQVPDGGQVSEAGPRSAVAGVAPGVPVPGAGGEPGGGSDGGARSGGAVAGVGPGAGQVPAGGRTPEAGPQPEGVVAGVAPDAGQVPDGGQVSEAGPRSAGAGVAPGVPVPGAGGEPGGASDGGARSGGAVAGVAPVAGQVSEAGPRSAGAGVVPGVPVPAAGGAPGRAAEPAHASDAAQVTDGVQASRTGDASDGAAEAAQAGEPAEAVPAGASADAVAAAETAHATGTGPEGAQAAPAAVHAPEAGRAPEGAAEQTARAEAAQVPGVVHPPQTGDTAEAPVAAGEPAEAAQPQVQAADTSEATPALAAPAEATAKPVPVTEHPEAPTAAEAGPEDATDGATEPPAAHIADPAVQDPDAPQPADAAVPAAPEAAGPQPAEPDAATPSTDPAPGEQPPGSPLRPGVPLQPQPGQTLGEFVPVEGSVPTTPHLAPTPPHPIVVPADRLAPEEPAVTVPAPRDGDAPAASVEEPAPEAVQYPDDLDTPGADPEETREEDTAAEAEAPRPTGPAAPGYDDAEREAVLKVMRERRDIRNGFRGDPIPHEVLLRVLEAAHTAPSVGHSQPWDFVVIRSAETRQAMHELAVRQREAYAKSLPKGRAKQFKELKIEAILDTPVNIVVTADPTRGGRHTLGRHTQPQMAPYSSALAVENLWLAARAEGLGVGWVSFFDEREMVRVLGLPEHLEVVAYLCVGYVDEFPDEPELMQAGWSKRRPLSWVVHEETYGRRALPGEDPHDLLAETVAQIRPLDAKALGEAWERQKRMTKPAGALGMLEIISAQLCGLSRQCPPPIPEPAVVAVFAGDHGVHAQGVTPWPQEVTAQMVANFLGGGAVCNAFAGQVGAEVCVVDVGVAADLPATPGLLPRKVRAGTSDMTTGPAMTREEAKQAIEVGIETARDLVAAGNKVLLTGEMGIANTTSSAALISVFTGADPAEVTGRGTGINDETLARKTDVVRRALELHQPDPADPIGVLAAIGGFEHAAMVGLLLGGASLRTPVILDGVSAGAAALVARAIAPEVLAACIAGHRSAEPGHVAALNKLGLRPLVDLDLRLGEGTGALLALPLVQSTARAMHEVATFDSAGVTEK
ncbi:nicotinate-nucleotide--dimethylbenzimidazole phosphoribosyltransferase [Streptomyces sp. NPDC001292]|uniref:nicotinate-nucleotide--dimethylbenzimidazole phosphoribosyltransferase n=1 Tax=Streptomyces sp. NPDC001292 TaxID=3364558 RepID=UPI003679D459